MLVFPRRNEHALDVPVERSHDADARKHLSIRCDHQHADQSAVTYALHDLLHAEAIAYGEAEQKEQHHA